MITKTSDTKVYVHLTKVISGTPWSVTDINSTYTKRFLGIPYSITKETTSYTGNLMPIEEVKDKVGF